MKFFDRIDNPIGLDLSDLSVKLVQLKKGSLSLELSAFSDMPLPGGLIEQDIISNKSALVSFLKELVKNKSHHTGHLKGRSIVASIPESKAFVRVINLPPLLSEELVTAVPIEAEQYIPLPIDQMQVDWQVVGQTNNGLKVFITATPRDYVRNLVSVFREAGLVTQSIEAESAAIVRALLPNGGNIPGTIILDMNATRTSLIVYGDNSIQFTSSIPMAGNALTEAIAQRLGVDKSEAERVKRLHGVPTFIPPGEKVSSETSKILSEISQAIEPILNNLWDEVKNTIKYHEQHADTEMASPETMAVTQIVLCGGTSKLPNLVEYLQSRAAQEPDFVARKMKVALGDAWRNVLTNNTPPFSRREALSYTTAIGLALRNYL